MQRLIFKRAIVKAFVFTTLCLTAFTMSAKAGLDSYEIYLNNKLIVKQAVNQPLSLKDLQLDKANANDQLVIHYSQCNAPGKVGKGRNIIVKDAEGKTLKEWKFADATGANTRMVIPVKELLALEKNGGGGTLNLYYAAIDRSEGQILAGFKIKGKSST